MRLLHAAARTGAAFDDENLVSAAGLVPVMRLAQRCGLAGLVADHVRVDHRCGANAPLKIGSVVAGMAAGADSIDDLDVIRHGGMDRLFGGLPGPTGPTRPRQHHLAPARALALVARLGGPVHRHSPGPAHAGGLTAAAQGHRTHPHDPQQVTTCVRELTLDKPHSGERRHQHAPNSRRTTQPANPSWLTKDEWAALQQLLDDSALASPDPLAVAEWNREAETQQPDLPTRLLIEGIAIDEVWRILVSECWQVDDVQGDNLGWDLTARRVKRGAVY